MRKNAIFLMVVVPIISLLSYGTAFALRSYPADFTTKYLAAYKLQHPGQTTMAIAGCTLCHTGTPSASNLNPYADDFLANGSSFTAIELIDSDGDTFSNLTEIMALPETYPGNAASHPVAGDTTKPVVSAFTIPATSSSLVIPFTIFTASDNVAVTGYRITETAAAPLAGAAGWTAIKPTNYTFLAAAGVKTLYAWAKDAAGNVSLSRSAAVTVTRTDSAKPLVSAFTIPATSSSLVIPFTTFTASDNVAVTGYRITETAAAPLAGAAGWTAIKPTNYTFLAAAGLKTLYAWTKDAAGNVSLSRSAAVTVTRTDSAKPVVTAFTMVPAATPNMATITVLTATDNVAVTGYKVTTTATAPLAGATGWTTVRPASFTFPTAGAKTLYAWAKDAAGNVSLSRLASVTVALAQVQAPMMAKVASQIAAPTAGLIPVPISGEMLTFVFAPTEFPVVNADPTQAMPIGIGPVATGGTTVNLDATLSQFAGPVDVYLTLYLSTGKAGSQTVTAYHFNAASNAFELIAGQVAPWQSGIMELNARVWDNVPLSNFSPGTYALTLEVTPAGKSDGSYAWSTSFTIQ